MYICCIKVDMNKVKLDTIKPWIGKRITELLGMEDDVVEEFVNNQLEADNVCKNVCCILHTFHNIYICLVP